ncbi:hypothetical protein [Robertkochia aurantiaca]|uniref:hypothetical protein n=1 Tax=Robertkochia aurantiaca TaxID=2873700 RepID=UPI001CCDF086|nr:hypothetical protein [Robertkochia sp. 3YJGBD-33]
MRSIPGIPWQDVIIFKGTIPELNKLLNIKNNNFQISWLDEKNFVFSIKRTGSYKVLNRFPFLMRAVKGTAKIKRKSDSSLAIRFITRTHVNLSVITLAISLYLFHFVLVSRKYILFTELFYMLDLLGYMLPFIIGAWFLGRIQEVILLRKFEKYLKRKNQNSVTGKKVEI